MIEMRVRENDARQPDLVDRRHAKLLEKHILELAMVVEFGHQELDRAAREDGGKNVIVLSSAGLVSIWLPSSKSRVDLHCTRLDPSATWLACLLLSPFQTLVPHIVRPCLTIAVNGAEMENRHLDLRIIAYLGWVEG